MQKSCLNCPVEFAEDAFGESPKLAELLSGLGGESGMPKVLIVADANVVQRTEGIGARIGKYVQTHGISLAGSPVVLSGGEKIKADNLQSALKVMSAALDAKLGKRDCILAMGGGSLLDVAGYAAAQVRGGIRIVRMPTTPAAMIDAAFADYAAVDSASVKDALRVPSAAAAIVIDTAFARTVLDGVWRGGIGEAVRLASVTDGTLMKKLVKWTDAYRSRDMDALSEMVKAAVAVRAKKGSTPFAEWCAMRLESISGYKLPHGYAVAIGICVDTLYAVKKGYMKAKDRDLIRGVLENCGALDGLVHSQHALGQTDRVLCGLDAWRLSTAEPGIVVPAGIGKSMVDVSPDRAVYENVLKELSAVAPVPEI